MEPSRQRQLLLTRRRRCPAAPVAAAMLFSAPGTCTAFVCTTALRTTGPAALLRTHPAYRLERPRCRRRLDMAHRDDGVPSPLFASTLLDLDRQPALQQQQAETAASAALASMAGTLTDLPEEDISPAAAASAVAQRRQSSKGWLGLLRQRMWTKMDFLHIHAVSGVVFSGVGVLWVANYLYQAVASGQPMEVGPDAMSLGLMAVGAVNCFSCIPMTSNPQQAGGFKFLGVGMTLSAIWQVSMGSLHA